MRRPYLACCVNWEPTRMDALHALIDASEEISRSRFLRLVDRDDLRRLESALGYGRSGLTMAEDFHVRYRLHEASGIPFVVHSAIEHVFAEDPEIEALQRAAEASDLRPLEFEPEREPEATAWDPCPA